MGFNKCPFVPKLPPADKCVCVFAKFVARREDRKRVRVKGKRTTTRLLIKQKRFPEKPIGS